MVLIGPLLCLMWGCVKHRNVAAGQQGLSVAFDLATHRGYDSGTMACSLVLCGSCPCGIKASTLTSFIACP